MVGNLGGYKTYRCDHIGRLSVESQRQREIVLSGGFASLLSLRPSEARTLGKALIAAADNAGPDSGLNPPR